MKNIIVICFAIFLSQAAFAQETNTTTAPAPEKKACCADGHKDGKACCAKGTAKAGADAATQGTADANAVPATDMVKKTAVAGGTQQSAQFQVWGNCGMCKKTIEKAAMAVAGVESANWDVDTHQFNLVYDASKTDVQKVHKAIAAAGYDTDAVRGSDKAYKKLHGCCQYDRRAQ